MRAATTCSPDPANSVPVPGRPPPARASRSHAEALHSLKTNRVTSGSTRREGNTSCHPLFPDDLPYPFAAFGQPTCCLPSGTCLPQRWPIPPIRSGDANDCSSPLRDPTSLHQQRNQRHLVAPQRIHTGSHDGSDNRHPARFVFQNACVNHWLGTRIFGIICFCDQGLNFTDRHSCHGQTADDRQYDRSIRVNTARASPHGLFRPSRRGRFTDQQLRYLDLNDLVHGDAVRRAIPLRAPVRSDQPPGQPARYLRTRLAVRQKADGSRPHIR